MSKLFVDRAVLATDNQFNPDWDQIKPFLDQIAELTAQRDELLEALEGVMYWDNGKPEWEAARAAIVKATGETK